VEIDKILKQNSEVGKVLQKSFEKIKYINPKDPMKLIDDIEKSLDDEINDKNNIDKVYFKPMIQTYIEWTNDNYELLRSPKRLDKLKVYHLGVKVWVGVLIQLLLFGRILTDTEREVNYEKQRIITLPKNSVPLYMKQLDKDGQETNFWELHTLRVIRKYLLNLQQQYNKLIRS
jgi:hypothetical protein